MPTIEESRLIKKQSIKNRIIIWWNFGLLPIFLGFQLGLAFLQSPIALPLDLIIGGTIGLNTVYFGANLLQKKMEPKEDDSWRPI